MINKKKVGVGIVTYNRKQGLFKLLESLPHETIDALIVVNDGDSYPELAELDCYVHQNEDNQGVGRSKNTALRYLLDQQAEHVFLIEDDIFIKDHSVFEQYIRLSEMTGIQHFNFSQHGINNIQEDGTPRPRMQIEYDDFGLALYPSCVGAFCYYSRQCLEKVGLMDEVYYNAVEHMDHTLAVINAGMHPAWHYFADLDRSADYLGDEGWSPKQSTISGKQSSRAISLVAAKYFHEKHGCLPKEIPFKSADAIKKELSAIHKRYSAN